MNLTKIAMMLISFIGGFQLSLAQPLFENVAQNFGLKEQKSGRVAFTDLNQDGYPDIILNSKEIFLNQKGKGFLRFEKDSVFQPKEGRKNSLVQVGDVNNDGVPDLFLGRYTELTNPKFQEDGLRNEIWLGDLEKGYTLKKDSGVGLQGETTISACFLDYDKDGNLDLFVGNAYVAYGKSLQAFPDRLFKGLGDGTFKDVTQSAGLLGIPSPGMEKSRKPTYGVAHTDWNNDGWQDLLVMTYGRQWNRLWKNNGDGTFVDNGASTTFDGDSLRSGFYPPNVKRAPEAPFRANGNTFDAAVADFDGDGDMDCFLSEITHWWAGNSSDLSMILVNQGAEKQFQFLREVSKISRPHQTKGWNQGDLHAGWLDVDNDGYLDLLIASSDYPDDQILRLYHQKPDHSFEDWTSQLGLHWLNASQISLGDFDRDGATDILVGTNNMRLTKEQRKTHSLEVGLLKNMGASRFGNKFFNVRLEGQAIGARVSLWIGSHRQTREVYGGLGHAGHRDDTDCRFGVGKADQIDKVEIRWPDAKGTIQIFNKVKTNSFYSLKKGEELKEVFGDEK